MVRRLLLEKIGNGCKLLESQLLEPAQPACLLSRIYYERSYSPRATNDYSISACSMDAAGFECDADCSNAMFPSCSRPPALVFILAMLHPQRLQLSDGHLDRAKLLSIPNVDLLMTEEPQSLFPGFCTRRPYRGGSLPLQSSGDWMCIAFLSNRKCRWRQVRAI